MEWESKNIFCHNCKKENLCKCVDSEVEETIKGITVKYIEKKYVCSKCNEEVFDKDAYNYNVFTANDELRKKTDLIRISEIEEILDKYAIGKKPLSLVLGLGEVTIPRYFVSGNPSKEVSDLLKRIKDNPMLFETYLISNKDKLTDITFKKSLNKVTQLMLSSSNSKLYSVALYLIKNIKDFTPLALQKLLYFINGFSNKILDKFLFDELPKAWAYGPVYEKIYNAFSEYKGYPIKLAEVLPDKTSSFTLEEKEYLDKMIEYFGCYSGGVLIDISHLTDPWIEAREGLEEKDSCNNFISAESIEKYFNKVCLEYDIKTVEDIKKYSTDMFEKVSEIM